MHVLLTIARRRIISTFRRHLIRISPAWSTQQEMFRSGTNQLPEALPELIFPFSKVSILMLKADMQTGSLSEPRLAIHINFFNSNQKMFFSRRIVGKVARRNL